MALRELTSSINTTPGVEEVAVNELVEEVAVVMVGEAVSSGDELVMDDIEEEAPVEVTLDWSALLKNVTEAGIVKEPATEGLGIVVEPPTGLALVLLEVVVVLVELSEVEIETELLVKLVRRVVGVGLVKLGLLSSETRPVLVDEN